MKKIILILILASFTNQLFSQWTDISLPSSHSAMYASFPDDMHGYVVSSSSSYIYRTMNGGSSWDSVSLGANAFDVDFISADTGFVIAGTFSQGILLTTYNGGDTWTVDSLLSGYYGTLVQFIDAENGYVTTNFSDVLKTTNGGTTWTAVPTGGYCSASDKEDTGIDSIVFTGWDGTFAYQGSVLRSDNNGISFQEYVYNFTYSQFYGSHFTTPSIGYAVHIAAWPLMKNYISKTIDGGVTWDSVVTDTTSNLQYNDVYMVSDNEGYVVANTWPQGTILHIMGNIASIEQVMPMGLNRIYKGGNTLFATGDGGQVFKKQIPLSIPPQTQPLTGIYPNPATTMIHIPLKETSEVSLLDLHGKVIQTVWLSQGQPMILPSVTPGMYIIRLSSPEGISTAKIIIE